MIAPNATMPATLYESRICVREILASLSLVEFARAMSSGVFLGALWRLNITRLPFDFD